ncbi:MAG: YceI family protein [Catenulispora sp.]|nr:YceI family protein [Catenulispora sp.]
MTTSVEPGTWHLEPTASTVAIKHKTMWGMVTVKGAFTAVRGEGEVAQNGTAQGTVTVGAASIDTKNTKRDTHLRSADFFDVEKHPDITLAIRDVKLDSDDTAKVSGQLTVRGISRPLALTARVVPAGRDTVTLTTEFTVDRDQFGMSWNQMGMIRGLAIVTASLRFTRTGS